MYYFSHVEIPLVGEILEPSGDKAQRPTKPLINHLWTLEQKVILCILARWYTNNWRERTLLFNAYFELHETSRTCGRPMSETALRSMWCHLKNGRGAKQAWKTVWHDTAFSTTSNAWAAARASLECIASELGLIMLRRTPESGLDVVALPTPRKIIKKKRSSVRQKILSLGINNNLGYLSSRPRIVNDNIKTPSKTVYRRSDLVTPPFYHVSERRTSRSKSGILTSVGDQDVGLLTPISSSRVSRENFHPYYKPSNVPCIGFRAYNGDSQGLNSMTGFRAGQFIQHAHIPSPINRESESYRSDARRHIDRIATGPTPFISVTKNLLRALHYAQKMTSPAYIAVFDLHQVKKIGQSQLGESYASIQSVESLDLESTDDYRGKGEYIIWGAISGHVIISIHLVNELLLALPVLPSSNGPFYAEYIRTTRSTSEARSRMKKVETPLTQDTGRAVGQLLRMLRISTSHLENAIYSIISDWKFCGWQRGVWRRNEEFMDGVQQGFRSNSDTSLKQEYHDANLSDQVPQDHLSTSDSNEETWDEESCDDDKIFDSGYQYEYDSMHHKQAHGKREVGILSEDRESTDGLNDAKQVSMNSKEMNRSMDEGSWAQAFRNGLEKLFDMESFNRKPLARTLFPVPLDAQNQAAGCLGEQN